MSKECCIEKETLVVRVKHGSTEIEVKIPMGERSHLSFDMTGTGTKTVELLDKMVDRAVRLAKEYPSKSGQTKKG